MKWVKIRNTGWLCDDGRYIARFNFGVCAVYLRYKSKKEYEKDFADYETFYCLRDAKSL